MRLFGHAQNNEKFDERGVFQNQGKKKQDFYNFSVHMRLEWTFDVILVFDCRQNNVGV